MTLNNNPTSLTNGNVSDAHSACNTHPNGVSSDPEHFSFVRECFVQDFMSGEVFNHVDEIGIKVAHDFYIH